MTIKEWLGSLSEALDLTDVTLDADAVRTLLDTARDAAHEVERVAAPLTTYLVGVAVGRGATLSAAAATVGDLLGGPAPADEDEIDQA